MLAWLESNRTAGTAVGADASDPAGILGGGRQFTFAQASGDSDIVIDYDFHYIVNDTTDTNVLLYIFSFERVSGAAIDATKLTALLLDTTISIENTSEVKEPGKTGGLESIVEAKLLDFGDFQIEPTRSGVIVKGIDFDDSKFAFIINPTRTLNYDALPDDPNNAGEKTIPPVWNFDTVHYTGSGIGIINLPNPSELIAQQGSHRTIAFHNTGTGTLIVNDWDGVYLIVVTPTDYVKFQITLEGEGEGGKILSIQVPLRRYEYDFHATTFSTGLDFQNLPYWNIYGNRYRMLPFNIGNVIYRDIDTFAFDTVDYPTGNQGELNDATDFAFYGIVEMTYRGILDIDYQARFLTDSGASGDFDAPAFRLYKIPADGSNPVNAYNDKNVDISGSDDEEETVISHSTRVDPGDRIMRVFKYTHASSGQIAFSDFALIDEVWNMTMKPHVERLWEN